MEKTKKPLYWIFIKSFTDMHGYKHFVSKNFLKAFVYMLLLTLILSVVFTTVYVISIDKTTSDIIEQLKSNTPFFAISNGELKINQDQPSTLVETSDKGTLIIIDTEYTGSITKYEEYETVVILAKNDIYLSNPSIRYLVDYETLFGTNDEITSETLLNIISGSKSFLYVFLYITIFLFMLFNYFMYTLLIALIVGIVRRVRKKLTNFGVCLQLSVFALTLPSMLYTLWMLTSINILLGDFLVILLAYLIASKGINAYYVDLQKDIMNKDKLV
jgi:hypothetical protein